MKKVVTTKLMVKKTPDDEDTMRVLVKRSMFGTSEVMQGAKRAFDEMGEDESLIITFRIGDPVAWRVEKK